MIEMNGKGDAARVNVKHVCDRCGKTINTGLLPLVINQPAQHVDMLAVKVQRVNTETVPTMKEPERKATVIATATLCSDCVASFNRWLKSTN